MQISDLIVLRKLRTDEDIEKFHELRRAAFSEATRIFKERAASYNVDHEPGEEMVYGIVSLASEMYKRIRRLTGLLSPLRRDEITEVDLDRMEDTCIDTMNYASWEWAQIKIARRRMGPKRKSLHR